MKKILTCLLGVMTLFAWNDTLAERYMVGVADWMVLKRQKLGEFELARYLGCDGVEMDMGGLGRRDSFDNKLREKTSAEAFVTASRQSAIPVGAVAMSAFYAQDFSKKDSYEALIDDCLAAMETMGAKIAFLPLRPADADDGTLIRRLRESGEKAKAKGMVIGVDAQTDAKGYKELLGKIHSEGIKVFYSWQNAIEKGLDISRDMAELGADNICAVHASDTDGSWIEYDKAIDAPAIKETLDRMGWSGWLFVERSRDTADVRNVGRNYGNNVRYLKQVFQNYTPEVKLDSAHRDADYVAVILKRSEKVTDELNITGLTRGYNVRNIVANRYFKLNDIYAERDSLKKNPQTKDMAETVTDSRLYRSHGDFLALLAGQLDEKDVEKVKDVMTYNVVKVTYDAQCDMIPSLNAEEKAQILAWLKEGREYAIDCESSKKKHEMFGKYKGRINNYLTKRGYNLTKEREEWGKRVKARGGSL